MAWFITSFLHFAALFLRLLQVTKSVIMASYLLLRNNKESGPFNLQELVNQGLKAYDLIWVTGKSAAWRYPGEIEELKQYAPAVEEQPYDRFYKKQTEEKAEEPVKEIARTQQKTIAPEPVIEKEIPKEIKTPSPAATRRSIFVTLPGSPAPAPAPQPAVKEVREENYQQYQPRVAEMAAVAKQPVDEIPTITIKENPVTAEIKYSQPLDEIKEMYVKTLQERKQKIAYKAFLFQTGKKVAVVLAIVGAGILIGLSIKSKGDKKEMIATANLPASQPVDAATDTGMMTNQTETSHTDQPVNNDHPDIFQPATSNKIPAERSFMDQSSSPSKKQPVAQAQQDEITETFVPLQQETSNRKQEVREEPAPGVDINESTGERSRKVRESNYEEDNNIPERKEPPAKAAMKRYSNSLTKLVSVESNEYQRVAFGGIRNLQLTVTNDSKYILDNVIVELQYLKPSEEPLRVETVSFRSIAPGGTSTIRIPDTNRGIKVLYKITHILSTQAAKDLAGISH